MAWKAFQIVVGTAVVFYFIHAGIPMQGYTPILLGVAAAFVATVAVNFLADIAFTERPSRPSLARLFLFRANDRDGYDSNPTIYGIAVYLLAAGAACGLMAINPNSIWGGLCVAALMGFLFLACVDTFTIVRNFTKRLWSRAAKQRTNRL